MCLRKISLDPSRFSSPSWTEQEKAVGRTGYQSGYILHGDPCVKSLGDVQESIAKRAKIKAFTESEIP
jgi:hypothetical protein